jgi:toxin FitB
MYLLDTVVLSELRKTRPAESVLRWIAAQKSEALFLSAITIGEVQRGIALLRKRDEAEFADALDLWLARVLIAYQDRIVPVSVEIARRWGKLSAKLGHDGADLMIAATAIHADLIVVTRNVKHFEPAGVSTFNPFTRTSS